MKKHLFIIAAMASVIGTVIGGFLFSLQYLIGIFQAYPNLIFLLPLAAVVEVGSELRWQLMRPRFSAAWVLIATLWSHLFGASVGRESTAVHIGSSIGRQLSLLSRNPKQWEPLYVTSGVAAGFAAAFGVPLTGTIFGFERQASHLKPRSFPFPFPLPLPLPFLFIVLLAALIADQTSRWLGIIHIHYPQVAWSSFSWSNYLLLFSVLLFFSLGYELLHLKVARHLTSVHWLAKTLAGSLIMVLITVFVRDLRWNNLGAEFLTSSFTQANTWIDFLGKLGMTFISSIAGLRGGEITPLMASGAILGSKLGALIGSNREIFVALSLTSFIAVRLRAPLTCTLMVWEIFGWKIALLAIPIHAAQWVFLKYATNWKLQTLS